MSSQVQANAVVVTNVPVRLAPLPTLESGDRLTRAEFERRYTLRPDIKKAELVEGEVYVMSSPTRHPLHGRPHMHVVIWLGTYYAATPGTDGSTDATVRLDDDNVVQPDVLLGILPEAGGRSVTGSDQYLEGAPELVAEIAASSASYDLHSKLNAYLRNGVREYVVVLTEDREVRWHILREGRYERLQPGADGIFRSEVFPGLWLNAAALLADDAAAVMATLQQGIASEEHAAFVRQLAETAQKQKERGVGG